MSSKVVAIKCPSCGGTRRSILGIECLWCSGTGRLRRDEALEYADQLVTIAIGGFVCGDHDWNDRGTMLAKADAICKTFGVPRFSPESAR